MKTLTITDLARSEHLDRPTMAAVRGGWKVASPVYRVGDRRPAGTDDASMAAAQHLGQSQNVQVATADGSALAGGVHLDDTLPRHGLGAIVRR